MRHHPPIDLSTALAVLFLALIALPLAVSLLRRLAATRSSFVPIDGDEGDPPADSGVREPRRPRPGAGAAAVELQEPPAQNTPLAPHEPLP